MRYALISDIHGNLDALEAVLADAADRDIDRYIFLGDYTITLHRPDEVAARIRDIQNRTVVRGNHEDYLRRLSAEDASAWQPGQLGPMYFSYRETSPDNLAYLMALPKQAQLSDGAQRLHAVHDIRKHFEGTKLAELGCTHFARHCYPQRKNRKEYHPIAMDLLEQDEAFMQKVQTLPEGIYLYGHNHIQSTYDFGRILLVNPGSCGIPLDGDTRAAYTVLDVSDTDRQVQELRVAYDTETTIKQLRASRLYPFARVFCELMISELETGYEHTSFFFEYVYSYSTAQNNTEYPYPREIWDAAYEQWDGLSIP